MKSKLQCSLNTTDRCQALYFCNKFYHVYTKCLNLKNLPDDDNNGSWNRTLQLHNERDGVSYHQNLDCLLNCLFRHRSKKTSKLRVTGLWEGNPPVTGEFPTQRANNTENVSIWWCHHDEISYFWLLNSLLFYFAKTQLFNSLRHSLTLKRLDRFFQNILYFLMLYTVSAIFSNWSSTMNVSALWILMAWCFSTRASVATVLTTHPCVSRYFKG